MEYKQVKYIMEENAQLKAEIERLRAALQEIASGERSLPYGTADYSHSELQVIAQSALGQQQPEPPQESLEIRILRTLAASRASVKYTDLTSEVKLGGLLSTITDMIVKGWIKQDRGYAITAAGRGYLASLDKPTPTKEYYPDDYPLAEGKTKAKLNIE